MAETFLWDQLQGKHAGFETYSRIALRSGLELML